MTVRVSFLPSLKGLKFAGLGTENLSASRSERNKGVVRHKVSFSIGMDGFGSKCASVQGNESGGAISNKAAKETVHSS